MPTLAPSATEHDHQRAFVRWADIALPRHEAALLFAIPNGGHRHKATAAKLRTEGVRAGVPDMQLAIPAGGFHGLFIEMKRPRAKGRSAGRPTGEQQQYLDALNAMGYRAVVCHG